MVQNITIQQTKDMLSTHTNAALRPEVPEFDCVSLMPPNILTLNLPLGIIEAGQATYDKARYGSESLLEIRQFQILLNISNPKKGSSGKAEAALDDYLRLMKLYFWARPRLAVPPSNQVVSVVPTGDGGQVTFEYGPSNNPTIYLGTIFRLNIESVTYIDDVGD